MRGCPLQPCSLRQLRCCVASPFSISLSDFVSVFLFFSFFSTHFILFPSNKRSSSVLRLHPREGKQDIALFDSVSTRNLDRPFRSLRLRRAFTFNCTPKKGPCFKLGASTSSRSRPTVSSVTTLNYILPQTTRRESPGNASPHSAQKFGDAAQQKTVNKGSHNQPTPPAPFSCRNRRNVKSAARTLSGSTPPNFPVVRWPQQLLNLNTSIYQGGKGDTLAFLSHRPRRSIPFYSLGVDFGCPA